MNLQLQYSAELNEGGRAADTPYSKISSFEDLSLTQPRLFPKN